MTEDEQTEKGLPFTRIKDISAQNVPLIAGPDDTVVGFDEIGGTVYRSKTGEEYTLYPETKTPQERPIVTAAKAVGEYLSDPSLPSLEETSEFVKETAKSAYEPFRKIASGDSPTYGDLSEVLPVSMTGAATRIGKPLDDTILSSGGAGPSKPKSQINPLFKPKDTEDPNLVSFYSPLVSAIGSMDIGAKGKSGRDIMAYLNKRAPNVSKGELQFSRLNLDPDKKYSREELLENLEYSLEGTVAQIRSGKKTIFKGQQIPKNYVDKPTDYFEITLDAKALPGKVNTHFGSETLAHSRTTAHVDASGEKYFVLNELQSDALQSVGKSFSVPDPVENVGDIKAFLGLDARVGYNERVFDFFEKEALKPTLDKAALKEAYKNTFGITAEGRDVGQIHKDALRKAVDSDISEGDLTYLESKIDYALKDFAGYQVELKQAEAGYSPKDIPFESTSAYVKNLLLANIARAKQEGVNKLVIPNLDEIARLRAEDFEGGFEAAKKALRPTYENAVKKAVNTLNSEYGNKIKVGTRNLEYKDLTQKSGKRTSAAKELDITDFNFDPATQKVRFAQGGMVEDDQMNRLMQEGGMADDGMNREPVTGNEIPPGSLASEVRDDIDVKLSEGEYVIPADVLRYYGVRFFEDLRAQAKQGMMEMEADGRIGGTPVNAQGVPMESQDEELTPEEEQMLNEVLGGSGMAYGGMVQQPATTPYQDQATMYQMPEGMGGPMGMQEGGLTRDSTSTFDRTQFTLPESSGAFESRKYINPTTGEEKTVQFLNGIPMGLVPEGFVPWTPALAEQLQSGTQTPTTQIPSVKPVEVERGGRDMDQTPTTGSTGEGSLSYDRWAEKNSEAITSDPYSFGVDALSDKKGTTVGKGLGLAGAIVGGPVGAVLGGLGLGTRATSEVQNIAEARAALGVMEAQGLKGTTQYNDLEARIETKIDDLPAAQRMAVRTGVVATGTGYASAALSRTTDTTPSTGLAGKPSGTTATPSKSSDKGANVSVGYGEGKVDPGLAAAVADKDKDKPGGTGTSGGTPGGGFGTGGPGNVGSSGNTSGGTPGGGTGTGGPGNVGSGNYGQGGSNATRRAEGGLISKPQKTVRSRKGLAS
jgi:hypothetical protein